MCVCDHCRWAIKFLATSYQNELPAAIQERSPRLSVVSLGVNVDGLDQRKSGQSDFKMVSP